MKIRKQSQIKCFKISIFVEDLFLKKKRAKPSKKRATCNELFLYCNSQFWINFETRNLSFFCVRVPFQNPKYQMNDIFLYTIFSLLTVKSFQPVWLSWLALTDWTRFLTGPVLLLGSSLACWTEATTNLNTDLCIKCLKICCSWEIDNFVKS